MHAFPSALSLPPSKMNCSIHVRNDLKNEKMPVESFPVDCTSSRKSVFIKGMVRYTAIPLNIENKIDNIADSMINFL